MLNTPKELRTCEYEINTEQRCGAPMAYILSWKCDNPACPHSHAVACCAPHRELVEAHIAAKDIHVFSALVN